MRMIDHKLSTQNTSYPSYQPPHPYPYPSVHHPLSIPSNPQPKPKPSSIESVNSESREKSKGERKAHHPIPEPQTTAEKSLTRYHGLGVSGIRACQGQKCVAVSCRNRKKEIFGACWKKTGNWYLENWKRQVKKRCVCRSAPGQSREDDGEWKTARMHSGLLGVEVAAVVLEIAIGYVRSVMVIRDVCMVSSHVGYVCVSIKVAFRVLDRKGLNVPLIVRRFPLIILWSRFRKTYHSHSRS